MVQPSASPRRPPLLRWFGVVLRGVHLAAVIALGAALFGAPLDGRHQALAVLATGLAMVALDLRAKPHLFAEWAASRCGRQARGGWLDGRRCRVAAAAVLADRRPGRCFCPCPGLVPPPRVVARPASPRRRAAPLDSAVQAGRDPGHAPAEQRRRVEVARPHLVDARVRG